MKAWLSKLRNPQVCTSWNYSYWKLKFAHLINIKLLILCQHHLRVFLTLSASRLSTRIYHWIMAIMANQWWTHLAIPSSMLTLSHRNLSSLLVVVAHRAEYVILPIFNDFVANSFTFSLFLQGWCSVEKPLYFLRHFVVNSSFSNWVVMPLLLHKRSMLQLLLHSKLMQWVGGWSQSSFQSL